MRNIALATSLLTFAATLVLWWRFDPTSAEYQFVETHAWIPRFGIQYLIGVDGISLFLLVLTGFLTPLALVSSWESVHKSVKLFSFFVLVLETAMLGVFVSIDLFLFYIFWDAMLIPMYFLIGIWGYERRIYAAVKFMLYTMAGSVLMLVAIIGLSWVHAETSASRQPSFNLLDLYGMTLSPQMESWFFLAFTLAFAIKVPLFPFHTWLPDAHVEAPTAGSVILAGVLLKMGTYGLLRFAFPLFPGTALAMAPIIAILAVIGIIYGALVAMVQPDMKKLVAYSSVSHLGFVVLGLCTMNLQGVQGSLYQMLNHGVSTGGLFMIVGMLSDRRHTRLISEFGGLKGVMPRLVAAFLIVTLSSIALPGLNGFVGEFLILVGAFRWSPMLAALAATGVILSAVYMLWMFQRVNYGPVTNEKNRTLPDLSPREWALVVPTIAMAILMGIVPGIFLRPMEPAVNKLIERVTASQPARVRLDNPRSVNPEPRTRNDEPRAASRELLPAPPRTANREPRTETMSDYTAIIPIVIVVLSGCAAMLAEAFRQPGERMPIAGFGLIGLVGAALATVFLWGSDAQSFGVVRSDNFALFINLVLCVVGVLTMLFSDEIVEREQLPPGEYYALTLFAISGMMLMAAATDLLVIFLALEVLSLSVYVLTGIRRSSAAGSEAAFKYFLLGAFSSAFFLYGVAFAFALSGSTRLDELGTALSSQGVGPPSTMALLAVGMLVVGFAFKISAVPFHMWTPDAYEGAPTIVTAFMSTGVKAAAFAAFVRVFLSALEPLKDQWIPVLVVVAAATMILGTVVGVVQTQHQADAGLLEHRARRIPAPRVDRDDRHREGGGAVLSSGLCRVEPWRARDRGAARHGPARARRAERFRRTVDGAPGARCPDDGVPALARRVSANGRLHRQVVHLQRGRRARSLLAGHHRRAVERRLRLLLPAHRRHDVHDDRQRRRSSASVAPRGRRARAGQPGCDLPRAPADEDPRPRDGLDRHHLLGSKEP